MQIQVGDQFDHYQIRSQMAQGGMSTVYRAYDLLTGQEVVLKIPDQMLMGDPGQYERFQRELTVMNTLRHPAIQRGIESGTFSRTPYLVTELVDGKSLRDLIDEKGAMPPTEAITMFRKIADGIAFTHANDVIHRDLKPENILIRTSDGQPVILDFGLALVKGGHRVTYANLTGAAGTPDYMAPEQIEGQRGDARTDIYALGIILFEMLTGKPPFHGDNPMAVMSQHVNGTIPRLDQVKPGVISPQLAAVVAHAVQRDPEKRYADVNAMIADLDHLDKVDTSILSVIQVTPSTHPVHVFWRSPAVRTTLIMVGIVVLVVILAVAATALRPH